MQPGASHFDSPPLSSVGPSTLLSLPDAEGKTHLDVEDAVSGLIVLCRTITRNFLVDMDFHY
ncbi:hypothetical protein NPIL_154081, partial [Nephila pilipes]